jgi:type II secretory pathway pseudopilin PulG
VRRARRGFILVEALVSVALAGLTAAAAITLLVWTARTIDRAQARMDAATVVERIYEEARLAGPAGLGAPASGVSGRFRWRRMPLGLFDRTFGAGPRRIRIEVTWTAGARPDRSVIEALVTGAGA